MKRFTLLLLAFAMVLSLGVAPAVSAPAVAEEELTPIIYYNFGSETFVKNVEEGTQAVNELLADYGIKLDMRLFIESEYQDKMNLIINSNEYYDICWTSSWRLDFYANVGKGAFYDISDAIGEYAPALVNEFPSEFLDFGRVDGKLYGLLNLQILANPYGIYIRQDMVDKYGIDTDAIKTLDDLTPVFDMIKEGEPDMYALSEAPDQRVWGSLDTEVSPDFAAIVAGDDSLTVVPYHTTQKYQDTFNYRRELYDAGYIREDIASTTTESIQTDMISGMFACMFGDTKPGGEAEFKNRRGWDAVKIKLADAMLPYNAGVATMHAVSVNTEHIDKALKYLELVNTNGDVLDALLYGTEGVHHEVTESGQIKMIDNSPYFLGNTSWAFGNIFNSTMIDGMDPAVWEETIAVNDSAARSPITGFALNTEPVQSEFAQLTSVKEEYKNRMYMPNYLELEEEYIAKLEAAGIDKFVEEVQRQVDVWAEANGKK